MKNRRKILLFILVILFTAVAGYFVYENYMYVSYGTIKKLKSYKKGNIAARVNDQIITVSNFNSMKNKLNDIGNLEFSDRELLDKLIETELLFLMAEEEGIKIPREEVNKMLQEAANYEGQTFQERSFELNNVLGQLGISNTEYWKEYLPRAYAKSIAVGKMRDRIQKEIYDYIIEKHPKWTQPEIRDGYNEMYNQRLEEFKKKCKIETYI